MTTPNDDDELLTKLQDLRDDLAGLSLGEKVVNPKREDKIENLRAASEELIATFARQRRQYTADAQLAEREALERRVGAGGGRFERFDQIDREAKYIFGQLAGPSSSDTAPGYLVDGVRASVQTGIEVLKAGMTTKRGS